MARRPSLPEREPCPVDGVGFPRGNPLVSRQRCSPTDTPETEDQCGDSGETDGLRRPVGDTRRQKKPLTRARVRPVSLPLYSDEDGGLGSGPDLSSARPTALDYPTPGGRPFP